MSTLDAENSRMNATYQYLDLVPKGRDEQDLPDPQAWVRYHDRYED